MYMYIYYTYIHIHMKYITYYAAGLVEQKLRLACLTYVSSSCNVSSYCYMS